MKFSIAPEIKIGILIAICIAVAIWGFKFMQGKNLLRASNYYYVQYADVNQLTATSAVYIRGLRVGTVREVKLGDDLKTVIATLDINKGIRIHKNTVANVVSSSIMGGRAINLVVPGPCSGDDCASKGDFLQGRVKGMFESMLGDSDFDEYVDKVKNSVGEVLNTVSDSIASPGSENTFARTFQNLNQTLQNLSVITGTLSRSVNAYDQKVNASLRNLETITDGLASNQEMIDQTIENLSVISTQIREANIGGTLKITDDAIVQATETMQALETTLADAETSFSELKDILADAKAGKGTLGKLLQEDDLYNKISLTSENLNLLLQDVRLNPKRYVNVSVFGKKQKDYVPPESDPAFDTEPEQIRGRKKKRNR